MDYNEKYNKYKNKYLQLKNSIGGKYEEDIVMDLNDIDNKLLDEVNEFVKKHCNEDHPLCSGMMHKSGAVQFGLSSKCPMGNDVHGEHAVISQARIFDNNKDNYVSLVSMTFTGNYKVKAPCGICRELLRYHYPNLPILVPNPITGKFVKIISKNLLPYPYVSTKLPENSKLTENVELVTKKSNKKIKKNKK
jgi:cytidine deaminase